MQRQRHAALAAIVALCSVTSLMHMQRLVQKFCASNVCICFVQKPVAAAACMRKDALIRECFTPAATRLIGSS